MRRTVLALCAALLIAGCGGGHKQPATMPKTTVAAACRTVAAPAPKGAQHLPKPTTRLKPGVRYVVDLQTNCGTISIRLANGRAPKTASSFANLVRRGFYDGLTFHRVVKGFMVQGGDPKGDGTGNSGKFVPFEKTGVKHERGVISMALILGLLTTGRKRMAIWPSAT